jgi:hypothetical protein
LALVFVNSIFIIKKQLKIPKKNEIFQMKIIFEIVFTFQHRGSSQKFMQIEIQEQFESLHPKETFVKF